MKDSEMTIRFTLAEKWQDLWFRKLSPAEKLLFLYMCDNCNLAGIWEVDLEQAGFSVGFNLEETQGAYKGLVRGYETLSETHIWLKNFLKHQRNLPLNPSNAAHATIINLLLPYKGVSYNILQLLSTERIKELTRGLEAPISISISKGKGKSTSKSKGISKKEDKEKHLDFVFLTKKEFDKLEVKFGVSGTAERIIALNEYIGKIGVKKAEKKYDSHYFTILSWDRTDERQAISSGTEKRKQKSQSLRDIGATEQRPGEFVR